MKRDHIKNLVFNMKEVFARDEAIARGRFKTEEDKKKVKPCAPHIYEKFYDEDGELWKCKCGREINNSQIIKANEENNLDNSALVTDGVNWLQSESVSL